MPTLQLALGYGRRNHCAPVVGQDFRDLEVMQTGCVIETLDFDFGEHSAQPYDLVAN